MSRGWVALAALSLAFGISADTDENQFDNLQSLHSPRGGTRALLSESDHKYKMHDPIKLYGECFTLLADAISLRRGWVAIFSKELCLDGTNFQFQTLPFLLCSQQGRPFQQSQVNLFKRLEKHSTFYDHSLD